MKMLGMKLAIAGALIASTNLAKAEAFEVEPMALGYMMDRNIIALMKKHGQAWDDWKPYASCLVYTSYRKAQNGDRDWTPKEFRGLLSDTNLYIREPEMAIEGLSDSYIQFIEDMVIAPCDSQLPDAVAPSTSFNDTQVAESGLVTDDYPPANELDFNHDKSYLTAKMIVSEGLYYHMGALYEHTVVRGSVANCIIDNFRLFLLSNNAPDDAVQTYMTTMVEYWQEKDHGNPETYETEAIMEYYNMCADGVGIPRSLQ